MKKNPVVVVRGYHLDVYGHVNNARYLEFLEEGRWSLFDGKLDLEAWKKIGLSFYVVNININYRASAVLGDVLEVRSEMVRIGNRIAALKQQVILIESGKVCVEADVTFVIADDNGKAVPMEGHVRETIESL